MTMSFDDVIISAIMSASKCSQAGSLSVTKRDRRQNTGLFLFNELI